MTSEEYKKLEVICKKVETLNLTSLWGMIKEKAIEWERRCNAY